MEPGQHLLVPPAGGGRDAGAGDRVRDGDRDRRARRGAPARRRGADGRGVRAHLVLRQRRRAVRRGAREAARDGGALGAARPRALRRQDARELRFRYGVQVNSLGLTESQPENNVQRIVLEALAVTLGRDARARAIQLPAWNEALGLPRPWDQQWSLRIQQVLAYETDLLEYPDIFEGSKVMDGLVGELVDGARGRDGAGGGARRRGRGGPVHEGGAGRVAPRADRADRVRRAGAGRRQPVRRDRAVAADRRTATAGSSSSTRRSRPSRSRRSRRGARRATTARCARRWTSSRAWPATDENVMPATIAAARAGVTTGEWAQALRDAFGSYRAPTGVGEAAAPPPGDGRRRAARRGRPRRPSSSAAA